MESSSDALTSKQNSKLNVHLTHKHPEVGIFIIRKMELIVI